ncbi:MAG: hypothetical protein VCD00_04280 [Candidatus Hydrogenedentota bacterium]
MTGDSDPISRRTFITSSVVAGTVTLLPGFSFAQAQASPHSIELARQVGAIGRLSYIQLHAGPDFTLETAAITIEQLAQKRMLEKVGALGNQDFVDTPDVFLSTLYFDRGLRATIVSITPVDGVIGVVRGEQGSIILRRAELTVLDKADSVKLTAPIVLRALSGGSRTYPLILEALREEKTVFAEK